MRIGLSDDDDDDDDMPNCVLRKLSISVRQTNSPIWFLWSHLQTNKSQARFTKYLTIYRKIIVSLS